jgi:hypothetical protein
MPRIPPATPSSPSANGLAANKPDVLELLWDQACSGQEQEAYNRLRELFETDPRGSELPARLYALLLANPALDSWQTPCDWLARGVRAEGPWGPCRQLYRREVDDHPEEVLTERFLHLIDAVAGSSNVIEFLAWRWEALTRLKRPEHIVDDLERVAPHLEHKDEVTWVRVLLKAADYVAWHPKHGFGPIREEVESHVHVHAALGEDMSRLDFLRELAGSWHKLPAEHLEAAPLVELLPLAWTNPYENCHRLLVPCRAMAEKPEAALKNLDSIHRLAPLVAVHLGQTLSWLWQPSVDERDEGTLKKVIAGQLDGLSRPANEDSYAFFRPHLLRLCIIDTVAPEIVANLIGHDRASFLCQRIQDDWPLRTVFLAHRLIWS